MRTCKTSQIQQILLSFFSVFYLRNKKMPKKKISKMSPTCMKKKQKTAQIQKVKFSEGGNFEKTPF